MTTATADKRHRRFAERRLDGLRDEPRPGAPRRRRRERKRRRALPAGASAPCQERRAMDPPNPESASA